MPDLCLLQPEYIDGYIAVTDEEAIQAARLLARKEGIFAGFSSGANLAAAIQLLQERCNLDYAHNRRSERRPRSVDVSRIE